MSALKFLTIVTVGLIVSACSGGGGNGGGGGNNPPADTTAPNTNITSGPADPTNSSDASFTFDSTEPGSTFECSLDGAAFSACTSPSDNPGLAEGDHTFEVQATDPAGNTDPTPAVFNLTEPRFQIAQARTIITGWRKELIRLACKQQTQRAILMLRRRHIIGRLI